MGRDKTAKVPAQPAPTTTPAPRKKPTILKSGNAGSSKEASAIGDAVPTPTPAQLLFPGWSGKTPLSLLYEACQKRGWERPIVEPHRLRGGQAFTGHVVLRRKRPKENKTDDVMLRPPNDSSAAIDRPTAGEAKHYIAIYALFRFANNTRMDIILPPACRSYWSELEKEKAATPKHLEWLWSTDPFAAASANANEGQRKQIIAQARAAEAEKGGSAKPSEPAKFWKQAPQVSMSQELREMVEATVRDELAKLPVNGALASGGPSFDQADLTNYLRSLDFRPSYIDATLRHLRTDAANLAQLGPRDAALEWLRIIVPEDDLPASMSRTKPLDMGVRDATSTSTDELQLAWAADTLRAEGFPALAVRDALRRSKGHQGTALDLLLQSLAIEEAGTLSGDGTAEERAQLRQDERDALQSIYGDRFSVIDVETDEVSLTSGKDKLALRWYRHDRSSYPGEGGRPTFIVRSTTLPAYLRLHLTRLLLLRLTDPVILDLLNAGLGGVISELVDHLQDICDAEIAHPPDPRTIMSRFAPRPSSQTTSAAPSGHSTPVPSRAPRTNKNDLQATQRAALEAFAAMNASKPFDEMLKGRRSLPAWSMRDELLSAIGAERVVLVVGETGSGKTTQVPAFVLEDELANGQVCSIVVTQPRRVSAISVAERVAAEHAQDLSTASNGLVGYAVRGERRASKLCRLLFCTTGLILRRMATGDPDLQQVTHVFVDEVHERSVDSDLLLLELKQVLLRNKRIKVILMSATIDEQIFAEYFDHARIVRIPGRTFPVTDFYLEDIVRQSSYTSNRSSGKLDEDKLKKMRSAFASSDLGEGQIDTLVNIARSDRFDYALVGAAVKIVLQRAGDSPGAILVFASGVAEISMAIEAINSAVPLPLDILPLHANLPPKEQSLVFRPTRHRKVIVSTNVAETSITIDDVVYVIDTGRVKETAFDPATGISRLIEGMTSRASANQRRGRAGRVREGQCWRLYDRSWTEPKMAAQAVPEMLRIPLERIILTLKASHPKQDPSATLARALSPPSKRAVESAWQTLHLLGAVEGEGVAVQLTGLGEHLAMLPIDVRLGKMLVLGAVFRCLDPMLTIAALLSAKPLYAAPPDRRQELTETRAKMAPCNSDLLADAQTVDNCRDQSRSSLRKHCDARLVSFSAYLEIAQLRHELLETLAGLDLVPSARQVPSELNAHSADLNLLCALIYASTQRLVRVQMPEARFDEVAGGTIQRDHAAREVKLFEPPPLGRAFVHPASVVFGEAKLRSGFVTYFAKQVTSKPFLRDVTEVPVWAVLLFASGGLRSEGDGIVARIPGAPDAWCRMRAWSRIAALASTLRRQLDVELRNRVLSPSIAADDSPVVKAMLALLARDGR